MVLVSSEVTEVEDDSRSKMVRSGFASIGGGAIIGGYFVISRVLHMVLKYWVSFCCVFRHNMGMSRKTPVSSYEKKDGTIVGHHLRTISDVKKNESQGKPQYNVTDLTTGVLEAKKFVFPDPAIVAANKRTTKGYFKSFFADMKRFVTTGTSYEIRKIIEEPYPFFPLVAHKERIKGSGKGLLYVGKGVLHPELTVKKFVIDRGLEINSLEACSHVNFSGLYLPEMKYRYHKAHSLRFDGAILDDSIFRPGHDITRYPVALSILNVSFDGASLRNASFVGSVFNNVSFVGADLKNVSFEKCRVEGGMVDFTDSNISFAAVESLFDGGKNLEINWKRLGYRKYDFFEAAKVLGISDSQLEFMILSNGIKVRDNDSNKIVVSDFDPEKHHIDQWEVQSLASTIVDSAK